MWKNPLFLGGISYIKGGIWSSPYVGSPMQRHAAAIQGENSNRGRSIFKATAIFDSYSFEVGSGATCFHRRRSDPSFLPSSRQFSLFSLESKSTHTHPDITSKESKERERLFARVACLLAEFTLGVLHHAGRHVANKWTSVAFYTLKPPQQPPATPSNSSSDSKLNAPTPVLHWWFWFWFATYRNDPGIPTLD